MGKVIPNGAEMVKNIPTIQEQVESILNEYPSAKGNDRILIYRYYRKYFPDKFKIKLSDFKVLFEIPSFETISRCRRKIQEEKEDMRPTDRTIRKRFRRCEAMRNYYSIGLRLTDFEEGDG